MFLLETWKEFEKKHGTASDLAKLEERMPRVVKKRRRMEDSGTWEEYLDYIFPEDEKEKGPAMKLLALAHKWKQQQGSGAAAKEDDKDDSDDDEEDEEESEEEEDDEDEDEKRAQVAEEASDEEERD
jgi:crooked neck